MAKIYALTEAETLLLREMARDFRGRKTNKPIAESAEWGKTYGEDSQAPETFIAKPVSSSIPALDENGTTAEATAGSGECEIYQIVNDVLEPTGIIKTVYNLSERAFRQKFIIITRDKFGKWIVVAGSVFC